LKKGEIGGKGCLRRKNRREGEARGDDCCRGNSRKGLKKLSRHDSINRQRTAIAKEKDLGRERTSPSLGRWNDGERLMGKGAFGGRPSLLNKISKIVWLSEGLCKWIKNRT